MVITKVIKCTLPLLLFAFVSCHKKTCFIYDVKEVNLDSVPNVNVHGEILPINAEYGDCIYLIDTFLVVHRYSEVKYFFDVYSSNTYDSIMSFGMRGRARNEFLDCPLNVSKQIYSCNGDIMMPLMDESTCKVVNFTKTLSKGHCVVDGLKEGVGYHFGSAVYYGDNYDKVMIYVEGEEDNMYSNEESLPKIMFINENGKVKYKKLFNRYMDNESSNVKASLFCSGVLFKQPEGNIVAQPISCMPYIFFYDLESRNCQAIHIEGKRVFDDGIPDKDASEFIRCFMDDAVPLKDYILVFYSGDYEFAEEVPDDYCGRILKLDWDGNIIKSYTLDNAFFRFGFDPEKEILYGSNIFTGKFFSFDLSD